MTEIENSTIATTDLIKELYILNIYSQYNFLLQVGTYSTYVQCTVYSVQYTVYSTEIVNGIQIFLHFLAIILLLKATGAPNFCYICYLLKDICIKRVSHSTQLAP